jgi:phage-related protein
MSANETLTLNDSSLTINGSTSGSDIFQFHSNLNANYTINNLISSGSSKDTIELDKSLLSSTTKNAWLNANVVQSGSDVIIHDGSNTITVHNATVSNVQHDILFV